jgi:hypothetical protein
MHLHKELWQAGIQNAKLAKSRYKRDYKAKVLNLGNVNHPHPIEDPAVRGRMGFSGQTKA